MQTISIDEVNFTRLAQAVRMLAEGRGNAVGNATLAANAASTTVTHNLISPLGAIVLTPRTANAAAEIGNGTLYIPSATQTTGSFVIQHANNAQTDRTYRWYCIGG